MTLDELCNTAHEAAKEKGFWDEDKHKLEVYALIHSEISEAVECVREAAPAIYYNAKVVDGVVEKSGKPEGELIELADAVIRIADYCGYMGWSLEEAVKAKLQYNKERPYKHGKTC